MKSLISIVISISLFTLSSISLADKVDVTNKVKTFEAQKPAIAADLTGNFNEIIRAADDTFTQLENYKSNDFAPHVAAYLKHIESKGIHLTAPDVISIVKTSGVTNIGGDGSAGTHTVDVLNPENWETNPVLNTNFATFNVVSGATLTVPSGVTIRSKGDVIIDGTITVLPGARGGNEYVNPQPGIALSVPPGAVAFVGSIEAGSSGGLGISKTVAASSFNQFRYGGGGGTGRTNGNIGVGAPNFSVNPGSHGGGLIRIISDGIISINGSIVANGINGLDGAGGGVIILQSSSSILVNSTLSVTGGAGGKWSSAGARYFGGGGAVIVVSPNIGPLDNTNSLVISPIVNGGIGGLSRSSNNFPILLGGGGGGASAGDGGSGGYDSRFGGVALRSGATGQPGYVIVLKSNPATMIP